MKTVILKDSSSSSLSVLSDEEDEFLPPAKKKLRSSSRLKPLDQTLTSTWNQEQFYSRQASTSFVVTAKSLGHDVSKIFVSPSIVYQARVVNRRKMARKIKKNPPPWVLHWERKLLPSVAHGNVKTLEDRVAILVTGKNFEQLFGLLVAQKGTGEQMAEVVIRVVHQFELSNIIDMYFDTTSSNTGLI
ncbi:unnamed protein product [Psylliodes chrysocephalus]|uniref:Uncharacterized protein n=1 Tax=Psylliodes chrysocephalus TaxID=3402493 RepID=A0A9P0G7L5_9CUCU|nr:unnamed protein product [Psylliodes chrysocephala]